MGLVVFITGLLVIAVVFTILVVRSGAKRAEVELDAVARTVPAPLTDEVRRWLAPQLARRSLYPALGGVWGLMATTALLSDAWGEVPWYWFAVLVGSGAGGSAGTLAAGFRTTPLLTGTGSVRTIDPSRRRVADHVDGLQILRLRLAVLVSTAALGLAVAIATTSDATSARQALLGCGLGVLLVVAYCGLTATLISRPMVTSTPEGLLWQKALLATTLDPLPAQAFLVALFSAVIGLTASVVDRRDLPPAVLVLGVGVALLAAASAAVVTVRARTSGRRPLVPSGHPAP